MVCWGGDWGVSFQNCSFLLTRKAAPVAPNLTWKRKDSQRSLKIPAHPNATMRARAAPSRVGTANFPMIRVSSGHEQARTPLRGRRAEDGAGRLMALLWLVLARDHLGPGRCGCAPSPDPSPSSPAPPCPAPPCRSTFKIILMRGIQDYPTAGDVRTLLHARFKVKPWLTGFFFFFFFFEAQSTERESGALGKVWCSHVSCGENIPVDG